MNPSLSRNFNTIVLSSVKYKVTTLPSPFFIVILRNPLRCRFHIMRKQLSCRVFSSTTASGTSVPSSLESLRSSMELLSDSVFEVEFLNQEENFRPSCLLVLWLFQRQSLPARWLLRLLVLLAIEDLCTYPTVCAYRNNQSSISIPEESFYHHKAIFQQESFTLCFRIINATAFVGIFVCPIQ